jgi:sulfatase maturation enzyme AslB (radical SAM superfamily)
MAQFRCASVDQRPVCAACEYRYFCGGGCGAHAFRAGGALQSEEPYCEVYRGLVQDHLLRESGRLLAQLDGPLVEGLSLSPTAHGQTGSRDVYGCT